MKAWQDQLFALRQRVLALGRRFDARPQRERIAIVLALAAVLLLASDRLWLTPAFRHFKDASQSLADARNAQQALVDESDKRRVQGDVERRALSTEIAQWKERTAAGAQGLAATQAGLQATPVATSTTGWSRCWSRCCRARAACASSA